MNRRMVATLAIAVIGGWLAMNQTRAQQDEANPHAAKIEELLQQRHDMLQQRYEAMRQRHKNGFLRYDQVVAAQDDLLKAKLEMTASLQQRLDICKQRVDNLRNLEQYVDSRVKTGDEPIEEKMLATASRLQAEIDCLRHGD